MFATSKGMLTATTGAIPTTPGGTPEARAESAALSVLNAGMPASSVSTLVAFPSTAYIGSIAAGITDDTVESLLQSLTTVRHNNQYFSGLKKWKRVQDASGQPKSFGFAEFSGAPAVARAVRLLNGMVLLRSGLLVKVDKETLKAIDLYEDELRKELKADDLADHYYEQDLAALQALCPIIAERGLSASLEGVETLIRGLRDRYKVSKKSEPSIEAKAEEARDEPKRDEPRPERRPSAPQSHQQYHGRAHEDEQHELFAFRDRERRWEQREAQMQRQRAEEAGRERDRLARLERERQDVLQAYEKFDDRDPEHIIDIVAVLPSRYRRAVKTTEGQVAPFGALFYLDRAAWKREREGELGHERDADARDETEERERMQRREEERRRWDEHLASGLAFIEQAQERAVPTPITDEGRLHELEALRANQHSSAETRIRKMCSLIPMGREALLTCPIPWHRWAASDRRWHQLSDILIARIDRAARSSRAAHEQALDYMHNLRKLISRQPPRDPDTNRRVFRLTDELATAVMPAESSDTAVCIYRRWVFEAEAETAGLFPAQD